MRFRRMKQFAFLAITVCSTFAMTALGGNVIGNSAHAVVCLDESTSAIKSVQLLDFYLARERQFREIDLGPAELNVYEKARIAFDRLQRLDPKRRDLYNTYLAQFPRQMALVQGPLQEQPDIYVPPMLPRECTVKQLAVRLPNVELPVDRRYIVDQELWAKLSPEDQAGMIVHEIVYRDSMEHNSAANFGYEARYLTGLFSSRDMDSVEGNDYQELMVHKQMVGYTMGRATDRWTLFDEPLLDGVEAATFCEHMGSRYKLATFDNWLILGDQKIVRRLQQTNQNAWLRSPDGPALYHLESDHATVVSSTPDERHAVVCAWKDEL